MTYQMRCLMELDRRHWSAERIADRLHVSQTVAAKWLAHAQHLNDLAAVYETIPCPEVPPAPTIVAMLDY